MIEILGEHKFWLSQNVVDPGMNIHKKGKIDYADFSKWLGNAFHMAPGFYFRQNTGVNPEYELQMRRQEENLKNDDVK